MSETAYIVQALLIGGVISLLVRNERLILRLQVIVWLIGISAIAWRFGLVEQLNFYSNDQRYYSETLDSFAVFGIPWDVDVWLGSKLPYTVAALPLAAIGIHPTLALKTASLMCLLALSRRLLSDARPETLKDQAVSLWLTACGSIGTFFSLLALRETMMMYFVYRYTTDRSVIARLVSFGILFLLRSHLATALIVSELVLAAWRWFTGHRRTVFVEVPVLIVGGVTLGTILFSIRFAGIDEVRTPFTGDFGRSDVIQIASNFVGLQFATSHEAFVQLSVSELLLLCIIFSDTILTPLVFTVVCFVFGNKLSERHRFVLLVFCIYVTIVTNTDFNSFRQNIPLMPLLGLVILDIIGERGRRAGIDYRRERAPALLVN